ncbi:MAG: prepilin-type N-terminal cleavage/methylation domain-containing protein [Planctomycetota bacterium]
MTTCRIQTNRHRSGLTLIEILIALTMTLIVLGAMMTAFQYASVEMKNGRASIELANRLRVTEEILRSDLSRLMLDPRPYTDSILPNGYFEYVEGPRRDTSYPFTARDVFNLATGVAGSDGFLDEFALDTDGDGVFDEIYPDTDNDRIPDPIDVDNVAGSTDLNANGIADLVDPTGIGVNYLGDYDDIWSGTIRSDKRPFRGRYIEPTLASATAYVTWDNGGSGGIYNRLVISPTSIPDAQAVESPLAEVVWWTEYQDLNGNLIPDFNESITLYRRLLLIVPPDTPLPSFIGPNALQSAIEYLACSDISARIVQTFDDTNFASRTEIFRIVPNTAKDLANRRNRFGHNTPVKQTSAFETTFGLYNPNQTGTVGTSTFSETNFPFAMNRSMLYTLRAADYTPIAGIGHADAIDLDGDGVADQANPDLDGDGVFIQYTGNDVMLTDIASFDFKVFSPNTFVAVQDDFGKAIIVEPSDAGFIFADPSNFQSIGAFVDLGHGGAGWFTGMPTLRSKLAVQYRFELTNGGTSGQGGQGNGGAMPIAHFAGLADLAYDTWTPLYESDGINQDGDFVGGSALIDEATNGIDNSGPAAPDDYSELETTPPYPYPVRGVKISIRLFERSTKQVHQSTVIHSYVPE